MNECISVSPRYTGEKTISEERCERQEESPLGENTPLHFILFEWGLKKKKKTLEEERKRRRESRGDVLPKQPVPLPWSWLCLHSRKTAGNMGWTVEFFLSKGFQTAFATEPGPGIMYNLSLMNHGVSCVDHVAIMFDLLAHGGLLWQMP